MALTPTSLITHLVARNLHLLALRISQYLDLRPDPVLTHWASAKISRAKGLDSQEDDVICRAIVEKFDKEGEKRVSFAETAKKAWEAGRPKLATMVNDMSAAHLVNADSLMTVARLRAKSSGTSAPAAADEGRQGCASEGYCFWRYRPRSAGT